MPLSEFRPHLHTPCEREIRPCVAFSTLTNPHLRRPPRRKGDTRLKPTGHPTNAYAMRRETYLPLTVRRLRFHSCSRPARCPFPSASFKELASTTFFKVSRPTRPTAHDPLRTSYYFPCFAKWKTFGRNERKRRPVVRAI